jgi:hypothetical protein
MERLGADSFQTFQVVAPKETHTVPATCEEVECAQYLRGWKIKLDLGTELGQRQAHYIKYSSGRSFTHQSLGDGLVELTFRANQPCFQQHRMAVERDPIFRVRGGDQRGNPLRTPTRVHKKPEFWVEEFAENQDRIASAINKG